METFSPTNDVRHLELTARFSQPIPGMNYRHLVRYSIVPKRLRSEWIRTTELVLNSEGVGVFLWLQSNQHRLFHRDISACETKLLRLVQSKLAIHHRASYYKLIRACLLGQLSVLVSQGREREHKELTQSHDLSQPLLSLGDTGLGLCLDTLSKMGSTCELLV